MENISFFSTLFLKTKGLYLYIYISLYIFIYPLLSFDLALLCKFSSNTSGTARGERTQLREKKTEKEEAFSQHKPCYETENVELQSRFWRKSFPAMSFLLVVPAVAAAHVLPSIHPAVVSLSNTLNPHQLQGCCAVADPDPRPLTSLWRTATENSVRGSRRRVSR